MTPGSKQPSLHGRFPRVPSFEQVRAAAEREAVAGCLAGRIEAFELLVREHSPRVIRLSYHFLGDWDEARDLAQETLARAYHCLDRYDPQRSFGTWLCTIAARLATDRLRRRKTRLRAERTLGAPRPHDADPETALSLREALDQLTPRQRQSVVLCDLHGFTAAEAAAMIGCSASTIRVQRFLARGRMRTLLKTQRTLLKTQRTLLKTQRTLLKTQRTLLGPDPAGTDRRLAHEGIAVPGMEDGE